MPDFSRSVKMMCATPDSGTLELLKYVTAKNLTLSSLSNMWIQRAVVQLIGRPILIPATFVAIGASYGTFKITRGVVQLVTPGLHPSESYSRPMYLSGLVAGAGVVALSEKLLRPLPDTAGAAGAAETAAGGIAGLRDRAERALRRLRPVRRGAALVGASFVAALVVEACFYSSRQQQQQQQQQHKLQQQQQQ